MPKIVDHQKMRRDLLQRSFTAFAREGYHGLSMRQLARLLNLTTGSLYHYFSSKEELFASMLSELVERDVTAALEKVRQENNPVGKLHALTDYVLENENYFEQMLFLLFDFYRHHDRFEKEKLIFEKSFERYRRQIETHLGLPFKHVGTMAVAVFVGLLVQRMVDPKRIKLKKIKNYLFSLSGPALKH